MELYYLDQNLDNNVTLPCPSRLQVSTRPPTIVTFVNDPKLLNDNYRRYLDRKFRENVEGFESTPIRWIFRGRKARDIMKNRAMNGNPGDGGKGTSFPFPYAD